MFRSRFFWRLYATYLLLVLVTATAIGVLIQRRVQRDLDLEIEARLWSQAAALLPVGMDAFTGADPSTIGTTVGDVAENTQSRVTLIAPDGLVVADAWEDPARMENHGDRPEFLQAMSSGTGTSRRFSSTAQMVQLYVARAVLIDDLPVGVVRVSIPLAQIDARVAALRRVVLQGAAVGVLLAVVLGAMVVRRVTAPIAEMSRVSEALRQGDYDARVRATTADEIGRLGDTLNRLADELTERLTHLTQQQAQMNAFLTAMPEGVVVIDHNDNLVFSNDLGRRLLGLDSETTVVDAKHIGNEALRDLLAETRALGRASRREIVLQEGSDESTLDARGAPFGSEESSGVVCVLYDITNLRRLERIRTDFVANVSHEIKTPLTSIQGYVETLLDGAIHDDEHNLRFLDKIGTQVGRLSALVSDLLSLGRIESSPELLETAARVDWRDVVADSVARRADPIASKRLQLTLDLPEDSVLVHGDSEAMQQIIDNLLDNAINYTPDQGRIAVRVSATDDAGTLQIADTGIGIPAGAIDRIFERFYRVDRGRSRQLGGTGLGLSIVRNLVRQMGGEVSVESQVGSGSTFCVKLPRA